MEILVTEDFEAWYMELDDQASRDVYRVVGLLEARGVALGYPQSSAIEGTGVALRELRVQSGGRPIRVFYAFDPRRDAVLILGGDRTGDTRFYERLVPRAEKLRAEYLEENF